jgi:hypothetical protein
VFCIAFTPPSGAVNVPALHFSHDQVGHFSQKRQKEEACHYKQWMHSDSKVVVVIVIIVVVVVVVEME